MVETSNVMRAVRLTGHGGPEVLERAEVPIPQPRAGEVLVRVASVALNNTDVWTRQGAYGLPGDPRALAGWRGPISFPRIQGADICGYVESVGRDVAADLVRRRVLIDPAIYETADDDAHPVGLLGSERDGGYAQYVIAAADRVHDVAASELSDDQLACLPTAYGTALGMIERGRVASGETVLVSGASGGVGLALVQIARARGARVLAISSGSKLGQVEAAGAHAVIDRAHSVEDQVRAVAPGGIDAALDVVAGDLLNQGISLLREGGRWIVAGALGHYRLEVDVRRLYLHNRQIIGSSMHTPAHFRALAGLARSAEVRPVVAEAFDLDDAARAQEALERREHVGKLILHP